MNTHIGFHFPFLRNEIPVFTGNLELNRQTITIKMTFVVLPVNPVSNTSHKQFSKYRPSPLFDRDQERPCDKALFDRKPNARVLTGKESSRIPVKAGTIPYLVER
ncbi:hypothetical protein [Burkholderia orbicola]|uniref:hypothetical protein n=1 Tax=Burkholderia orbicola TaxID=2978683 RepID=UPI001908043D|nr:hypothetical protein [Burkholderia orbicola]MBK1819173.1 hypothetical protein [Burkholderia orbicola]